MARSRRVMKEGDANYHIMSRVNNKAFLFNKGTLKTEIVKMLKKSAEFSGIKLYAYSIMDNHFHVVCRVVKTEGGISEETVLKRIAALKGEKFAAEQRDRWETLHGADLDCIVAAELNNWRRRMENISEFTKTFKQLVDIAYKKENKYCGSIWSGRFASTLIEDGKYLRTCIRYVELNPVRAGIVKRAEEYAWSSWKERQANEDAGIAGSVPGEEAISEARLMKRVAQIGAGKIFGSYAYVMRNLYAHGQCFTGGGSAQQVAGAACSSHGHNLAKEAA